MKNPYPVSNETSQRQRGGHSVPTGEKHGQKKASTIPAAKRYDGAEDASLENSPGRVSSDHSNTKK
jgi:hypothetical protein